MNGTTIANRVLLVLIATVLLVLSGTLAYGVVLDHQTRGFVTQGVTVAGKDLSGLSEQEAREAIEESISTPMLRPLTVLGDDHTWTLDPAGIVKVDVDAMLDAAYTPKRNATIVQRLSNDLAGIPIPAEVEPVYSVDTSAVTTWVSQTATQVDRKPINAKRKIVKYKFKFTPEVYGARVDQAAAVQQISQALTADAALSVDTSRTVQLPVNSLTPKITRAKFKQAIIVSISQCKIRFYKGDKLVKSYPCAPGTYAFPTPTGDFEVVTKLANAPWINPGSDWAKNMPASIPPGPNNPMGVRKIGINYSGVFMHGVPASEYSSIGHRASHGCMRMMPSDVLDLFKRVKLGTPVYIRP